MGPTSQSSEEPATIVGTSAKQERAVCASKQEYLAYIAHLSARLEEARRDVRSLRSAQADQGTRRVEFHVFLLRCLHDYEVSQQELVRGVKGKQAASREGRRCQ